MRNILIIFIVCLLSGCYIYRTPQVKKGEKELTLKQQIVPENRYKIITDSNKVYKIKAVKWDNDTLISYINGNKKKELKLHLNQVKEVQNRVFSRGRSDALTFTSYTIIGAFIYFLFNN